MGGHTDMGEGFIAAKLVQKEIIIERLYAALKTITQYETPDQLRRVREFASKEVADCIVDGKVNLMVRVNELQEENDKLRGIIAKSSLDCMYCGLPKADMAKCAHGFPGCGRADDMMVNGEPNGPQSEPAV